MKEALSNWRLSKATMELNAKISNGTAVSSEELEGFTVLLTAGKSSAIIACNRWRPDATRSVFYDWLKNIDILSEIIEHEPGPLYPNAPTISCKWAYVLVDAVKINDYIACLEDIWPRRFLDPNKGDVDKATRAFKFAFYGYVFRQVGPRIWSALVAIGLFAAIKKWFT